MLVLSKKMWEIRKVKIESVLCTCGFCWTQIHHWFYEHLWLLWCIDLSSYLFTNYFLDFVILSLFGLILMDVFMYPCIYLWCIYFLYTTYNSLYTIIYNRWMYQLIYACPYFPFMDLLAHSRKYSFIKHISVSTSSKWFHLCSVRS